jgi:tetratricopeptide (TPR) repeat protein
VNVMARPPATFGRLLVTAQACAARALELNPRSAVARLTQAVAFHQAGHPPQALRHFRQAVELDPSNADATFMSGFILCAGGHALDRARRWLEEAASLDPLTPINRGAMGWQQWFAGGYQEACVGWRGWQAELERARSPYLLLFAWLHAAGGDTTEALRLLGNLESWHSGDVAGVAASFFSLALLGRAAEALAIVTSDVEEAARWDDLHSLMLADGYALVGERDRALLWLEHAVDYGFTNVEFLQEREPFLVSLRTDPRFARLVEKAQRLSDSLGLCFEEGP